MIRLEPAKRIHKTQKKEIFQKPDLFQFFPSCPSKKKINLIFLQFFLSSESSFIFFQKFFVQSFPKSFFPDFFFFRIFIFFSFIVGFFPFRFFVQFFFIQNSFRNLFSATFQKSGSLLAFFVSERGGGTLRVTEEMKENKTITDGGVAPPTLIH